MEENYTNKELDGYEKPPQLNLYHWSLGSIFRFLGLCVCLGVQQGLSRVLIKYSGNVRLQSCSYIRKYMKNFIFAIT